MSAARLAALAAVAISGCVAADQPVLTAGPTLTTCAQVEARANDLQPCDFDGVCSWSDPPDPNGTTCCTYFALCAEGQLVVEPMCPAACQACMSDAQCPTGTSWCTGSMCSPCVPAGMCPPCPIGTVAIERNGCATCTCAPASECADPSACDSPIGEQCYRGQVCSDGCAPGDAGCCANVCAAPGCSEPAPQGCRMDCPMENCPTCMATDCTCTNGAWTCTPVCSDVVGPCFLAAT